jgi:GxxExxY protein
MNADAIWKSDIEMMNTPQSTVIEADQMTKKIIGAAFTVGNELGTGFLEKVYENALFFELKRNDLKVIQQHPIQIKYKGIIVGDYVCDLLVNDSIIVEIKCVRLLDSIHTAQCLNYLRATGKKVCLLINFGKKKVEIKRLVHHF